MSERVVLVTGSTDGIGRQTARALAAGGTSVIVHGRSKPKVEAALAQLREELPGAKLDGVSFDLGQPTQIRNAVGELLARTPVLHALVNNAGIFASEHVATSEGVELTFAVNCLGPFLLTELLMPRLLRSATDAPSRVIDVASMAATRGKLDFGDLQMAHRWSAYAAYANSKLANIVHALALADRHDATKLVAYSLHPGVIQTKLLKQGFGPVQGGTLEQGARTSVRLAAADIVNDGEPSGSYFVDGAVTQPPAGARDPDVRTRLWDSLARLAKL